MCMYMKEEKSVLQKRQRLLQRVLETLAMSVVSAFIECIRRGKGNRFVSLFLISIIVRE